MATSVEVTKKWGPQLAATLGGVILFDGDEYRLIQFDFESDTMYLEQEEYNAVGYSIEDIFTHYLVEFFPPDIEEDLRHVALINPPKPITPNQESKIMKTSIVAQCKNAAISAAEYQAGKALNIALIKAIKPHAPLMVRGYLDSSFASPLLAVALAVLADQLSPDNSVTSKVQKASKLMLSAAFLDGADKLLDVDALISGLFDKLPPEAAKLLTVE